MRVKLLELAEQVQKGIADFGLAARTVENYRICGLNPIRRFFDQKKEQYYSKKLVDEFASIVLEDYRQRRTPRRTRGYIQKYAALLEECKNTGEIKRAISLRINRVPFTVCQFENALRNFRLHCEEKGHSKATVKGYYYTVKRFLHNIEKRGILNLKKLSRSIVGDYVRKIDEYHSGNATLAVSSLKSFFVYLFDKEIVDINFAPLLHFHPIRRKKYHDGLSQKDVQKLIHSIPFDTLTGKRDLAIIVLAESTGLRAIDVSQLTLTDIDWPKREIKITQSKTKYPLVLPLERNVGDALAEYILHARPESTSPFVFLSSQKPFQKLSSRSISETATKYTKLSGIENGSFFRRGFHCFRRSLGTWLLEAEMPLSMISEILGHSHPDSIKPYLSMNLEGLRNCAIGFEGIEIQSEELR